MQGGKMKKIILLILVSFIAFTVFANEYQQPNRTP